MVAIPQIGRKLAKRRAHHHFSATSPNTSAPGALAALLQEFRDEAARMTLEQIAAEDGVWERAGDTLPRLTLPVPDVRGHD